MRKLTIEELRRSEIESLDIFVEYCKKNNLTYYLAFGSLLGAVRHKGFIPWDDDIDILMPRNDYNFFIDNFNKANIGEHKLICGKQDYNTYFSFSKIIDTRTILIETGKNYNIGAYIDIFPLDNLPNNKIERIIYKNKMHMYLLRMKCNFKNLPINIKWYKKLFVYVFNILFKDNKREKIYNYMEKYKDEKNAKYYTLLHRFYKFGVPELEKDIFLNPKELEFSKKYYKVPNKYDEFLTMCYKDYMKLPIKEEQISHHNYTCYWKENAVILAAGLGSRILEISKNIPKPLIKINGKPIIESIIETLNKRNINKIYVVIGYMKEKFNYLTEKYPNVILIYNNQYNETNNIFSLYKVKDLIREYPCFICEGDQYISDSDILLENNNNSYAVAQYIQGKNISLVYEIDNKNRITDICKTKENAYNMCGITYLTVKDLNIVLDNIEQNITKYKDNYWDIALKDELKNINIYLKKVEYSKIYEVDTFEDLCALDKKYLEE